MKTVKSLLFILTLCLATPALATLVLENPHWRIELDPSNLAIRATPGGASAVQASAGVDRHRVSSLHQDARQARWQWDDGAWALQAQLVDRELQLSIKAREPGSLALLRQPGSAAGKGWMWPLGEGHYVPSADTQWQTFLVDQGELNTTQDLSLPLWGVDHGHFTLNWLLTHPFNNRLSLRRDGQRLAIHLSHQFTALEPDRPMTLRLYLGAGDPLAGAKRYQQWLTEAGRYEPLADKLATTPDAHKLVGASHLYLWGSGLLGATDVVSWPLLTAGLRGEAPLAQALRARLGLTSQQLLEQPADSLQPYQRKALLRDFNAALNAQARQAWQAPAEPDMTRLAQRYGQLRQEVADTFGAALAPDPRRWGDTFSVATLARLEAAGLPRLWLGLGEAWEGGLWHPEAVRAGVAAGYLVAPYDSYETALPATGNPDWTTGHLGRDAHRRCAVVQQDGQLRKGFLGAGHYTDPRCVMPLMQARVQAIQDVAGFNSWFLDVTAAGMVFDSYRTGAPMSQAQNAEGNVRMGQWLADRPRLVAGSEDGNAVTARGVVFAHGMQTPVIGWGDPDLDKNAGSPFYLGKWYPPEQPEVFFKPVPMKEPYRTVHFAPQTRLPLYQAVFHGSVITSHHWTFDNLKLSNVRVDNELAQLLYNVAPLYHLSAATLDRRLPVIQRQDAFFRPLHERLATQALTGFQWLSTDRLVQQTTFADGTRLIANFAGQPRQIQGQALEPHSVTAVLSNGAVSRYQSRP